MRVKPNQALYLYGAGHCVLALIFIALVKISPHFDYNTFWIDRPLTPFVGLMVIAGAIYLALIVLIPKLTSHKFISAKKTLLLLVVPGLLLRAIIFPAEPMQEDDFYRYLWDGGVTAEGFNPYTTAPAELVPSQFSTGPLENTELQQLAEQAGPDIINRVNHPYVKTIYPPVTQAFFALSYLIEPWSLTAWRALLVLVDILALILLIAVLKGFVQSPLWAGIYWWNPLAISETINAAHMDVLLVPALLAVIFFLQRNRSVPATLMLAIATAIKLWPALLIAPFLRAISNASLTTKVKLLAIFSTLTFVLLLPQLLAAIQESGSGVRVYSDSWQTNAMLFNWLLQGLYALPFSMDVERIARLLVAIAVASLALFPLTKQSSAASQFVNHSLWVIAALLLLSPTGYPWYTLWILPFLAIRPNLALLLLTLTLPLYDLRYYLAAIDKEAEFSALVITLQFLPTCLLLLWQGYRFRKTCLVKSA